MAVDLGRTDIDPSWPEFRRMLENLQANILKPHGRKESNLLVLRFTGEPKDVRAWIRRFAREEVTSMRHQLEETRAFRDQRTPGRVVASLALSAPGYAALGLDTMPFGAAGESFRNGMKHRPFSILAPNRDPVPSEWEKPYRRDVHALVSLSDDSADAVEGKTRQVTEDLRDIARVVTIERGTVLRNAKGEAIEPFGYIDARSQPLFLHDDLEAERRAGVDRWEPSAPLGLVLVDDPHTDEEDSFGSYLVFRKLRQDVDGFNAGVRALASRLSTNEALAGALVVGRFKDGTPVTQRPSDGLGAVNNFDYLREDRVGNRCPFHAHIRKANQRGANPLLSAAVERTQRIVRRGIPFGIRPAPDPGPEGGAAASRETGLLFLCFQADIGRQFEFIQRSWVDNPNFPEFLLLPGLNTGDDALIGQRPRATQRWPLEWGTSGRFLGRRTFNFGDYVRLRGGEYLFVPSLSSLRNW
jgi:Dyp-type peroxidase family